jgi:aspartate aminotransferase/aminotransferase
LITCAPTILLYYVARYFDEITAVTIPQARLVVEKRERVGRMIDRLKLDRLPGASTFYFFVSLGKYAGSALDFSLALLLDDAIAVVPGTAYGASTSRFIRVSVGTESEERIWEALQIMRDRIGGGSPDPARIDERLAALGVSRFATARD